MLGDSDLMLFIDVWRSLLLQRGLMDDTIARYRDALICSLLVGLKERTEHGNYHSV